MSRAACTFRQTDLSRKAAFSVGRRAATPAGL